MNRVEHAICRIRERLPQQDSFVTLGVGCVVRNEVLAGNLGWKCPNLLVTSVDVLSPQHLSTDRIFTAEFLVFEKKGLEVFELKSAAEFCKTLCGRNFEEQSGSLANEQLTVISVEPLDKRGFLKRMVKKSSLQTTRPIDCFDFHNYDNEIADGIFCNVIREFGSFAQEFESRTYKFKFSESRNVYLLEDFLRRDVELEEQCFPSDQVLGGAVVFSKQGFYLGCLAYHAGRIVPSFIPDGYLQLQAEEKPEEEEEENEVEGLEIDTEKNNAIDENENRDLNEKKIGLDNENEQACSTETLRENLASSVVQEKQELDDKRKKSEQETALENKETENCEGISQDEIVESDHNTDNEHGNSQRESAEIESFVGPEANEASENEREGIQTSSIEKESDLINDAEVENPEQNKNQEYSRNSSEIEPEETENANDQDEDHVDESECTHEQEESNNGTDILNDQSLDKESDISTSASIGFINDTVGIEPQSDTMETERKEDNTLDDNIEKSIEVEVTEPIPEIDNVVESEPCVAEPRSVNEVSSGIEKSSDMETDGYHQETEIKPEDQETHIDIGTSLQDNMSVDSKPSEEIPWEVEEASASKEDKFELEMLNPQTSIKEETKENDITEETADEKIQISSEEKHPEIPVQESPKYNLELLSPSEERKPSQQDGIIVIQEVTMSADKQDEITRGVIELDKPVKPEEAGEPLEPDDLLTTKITNNPKTLEDLAILLDTEYQHGGVSSWYDLAELLAIPKEAYSHCMSFSKPSPTEDLLVFLSSTKPQFSISDLKDSLRSINRQDVVHIIDRYIARAVISNGTVIQGVIEREDIDLLGELALKLDRGHHSNWKVLARQLEVPSRIFRNFGSHQRQNSALLMLKYLPIFDPDLTVESLKDSCRNIGLNDLVKFLDSSGVPGDDAIMDILGDSDFIGELSDNLNEEDENGPNWKQLGRELKIPEEKFSIFEPSSMNSPTKMLLQSVAMCEPDITVDELILALVAMKRHDIIQMLGKHFRNSDIRSILEENNCLPPQPESPRTEHSREDAVESTA